MFKKNIMNMEDSKIIVAKTELLNISTQKLSLVATLIRRQTINKSLRNLMFCNKKAGFILKDCLNKAISNIQKNKEELSLDTDKAFLHSVYINKGITIKKNMIRARGRSNLVRREYSRVIFYIKTS